LTGTLNYLGSFQDHFILKKKIKQYIKDLPKKNEEKEMLKDFDRKNRNCSKRNIE
jgi:hypothetical protein